MGSVQVAQAQVDKKGALDKMNDSIGPNKFKNAGDALKDVQKAFNDWSSILTSHSIQIAFAIIAANWAVHGRADAILENSWSRWSMGIAICFLGINLLSTNCMAWLLYKRSIYAEADWNRWEKEYEADLKDTSKNMYWPYDKSIQIFGEILRELKCWMPFSSALLFVISLFLA